MSNKHIVAIGLGVLSGFSFAGFLVVLVGAELAFLFFAGVFALVGSYYLFSEE